MVKAIIDIENCKRIHSRFSLEACSKCQEFLQSHSKGVCNYISKGEYCTELLIADRAFYDLNSRVADIKRYSTVYVVPDRKR